LPLIDNTKVQFYKSKNKEKQHKKSFNDLYINDLIEIVENSFNEETLLSLALKTGFIKRGRKITASSFVKTLMYSVYSQKNVSLPDITDDYQQYFDIDISKEALHKRFTASAVEFLKEVIKMQLSQNIDLEADNDLKSKFKAVNIKDSTKFLLPSIYGGDYPSFNNFSKEKGALCIQFEYDLISGNWLSLEITKGTRNDQADSKETLAQIKEGELYIRDLAYATTIYLEKIIEKKAFFLNRLKTQIGVYLIGNQELDWKNLDNKFKKSNADILDLDVLIHQDKKIPCRLIIQKVSEREYQKRLKTAEMKAKSNKLGLTDLHKIKMKYNTFITNVDRKDLSADKIRKTYYLRWQIELVFKTWKSFFKINEVKKVRKERLECQLLANLIWILVNWRFFQAGNQYVSSIDKSKGVSVLKFFKKCQKYRESLRNIIQNPKKLKRWIKDVFFDHIEMCICEAPKDKTTHYQIIIENLYA